MFFKLLNSQHLFFLSRCVINFYRKPQLKIINFKTDKIVINILRYVFGQRIKWYYCESDQKRNYAHFKSLQIINVSLSYLWPHKDLRNLSYQWLLFFFLQIFTFISLVYNKYIAYRFHNDKPNNINNYNDCDIARNPLVQQIVASRQQYKYTDNITLKVNKYTDNITLKVNKYTDDITI